MSAWGTSWGATWAAAWGAISAGLRRRVVRLPSPVTMTVTLTSRTGED